MLTRSRARAKRGPNSGCDAISAAGFEFRGSQETDAYLMNLAATGHQAEAGELRLRSAELVVFIDVLTVPRDYVFKFRAT